MNENDFKKELKKRIKRCAEARAALNKVPGQSFGRRPKGSISSSERYQRQLLLDGQEQGYRAMLEWVQSETQKSKPSAPPSGALAAYHAMGDCDGPGHCPLCG